jgi:hypothetical protein
MMDASQDPTQDPSQDPDQGEAGEQFSVTITSNGDGTYTVSSSDSDESEDDPSGQSSGSQDAKSVDEALNIAGQMLQEESSEDSSEDGNAPLPSKDAAQAAWNQMASKRDKARSM